MTSKKTHIFFIFSNSTYINVNRKHFFYKISISITDLSVKFFAHYNTKFEISYVHKLKNS